MTGECRLAPWPENNDNPYQRLFYGALERFGIRHVSGLVINDQYLRDHASDIDAIHLHWPEYAWRVHGTRPDRQLRLLIGMTRFLRLAARLGIARLWTAHNVRPHEIGLMVDYLGYRTVARNADLIIAHGDIARADVQAMYGPRCPVVVMPQGNYEHAYPPPRDPGPVRSRLGCPAGVPLLSCVGTLRPYKGFELAIQSMGRLQGEARLVIAGGANDREYVRHLEQLARQHGSTTVIDRTLDDQEFADLVSASDAVLLPYRKITTSAVLLVAWGFGRGAVATPLPYFQELLRDRPAAGHMSDSASPEAFAAAIRQYLAIDASVRTAAARSASADFAWENLAPRVAEPIRQAIRARRGSASRTG